MSVRFSIWFSRNQISLLPVADVGFPIGEPKIWQLFPENYIEIRKIGLRGGGVCLCAPKSAIYCVEKWKQWRVQSRCDCQVTGKTGHHSNWGNFGIFCGKESEVGILLQCYTISAITPTVNSGGSRICQGAVALTSERRAPTYYLAKFFVGNFVKRKEILDQGPTPFGSATGHITEPGRYFIKGSAVLRATNQRKRRA